MELQKIDKNISAFASEETVNFIREAMRSELNKSKNICRNCEDFSFFGYHKSADREIKTGFCLRDKTVVNEIDECHITKI